MPAFNMDAGPHADAVQINIETEEGNYSPVITRVTMSHTPTAESAEERQARLDADATTLKVSRMFLR